MEQSKIIDTLETYQFLLLQTGLSISPRCYCDLLVNCTNLIAHLLTMCYSHDSNTNPIVLHVNLVAALMWCDATYLRTLSYCQSSANYNTIDAAVWYVSNVSIIFDCSMLYYLLFWTLLGFIFHFYIIFGTNLLTGGPAQNCCFLPVLGFRRKGISNGVQTEWNLQERDFLNE